MMFVRARPKSKSREQRQSAQRLRPTLELPRLIVRRQRPNSWILGQQNAKKPSKPSDSNTIANCNALTNWIRIRPRMPEIHVAQTALVLLGRAQLGLGLTEQRRTTRTSTEPTKPGSRTCLGMTSKFKRTALSMTSGRSRMTPVSSRQLTRPIHNAISTRNRADIALTSRSSLTTSGTNGLFSMMRPAPTSLFAKTRPVLIRPWSRTHLIPRKLFSGMTAIPSSPFSRMRLVRTSPTNRTPLVRISPFSRMRLGRTSLARRSLCAAIPMHSNRTPALTSSRQRAGRDLVPRNR